MVKVVTGAETSVFEEGRNTRKKMHAYMGDPVMEA